METYLYFRDVANLAADDDGVAGSLLFPLSSLKGMTMGTAAITGAVTDDEDAFKIIDWFSPIERLYPSCGIGSLGSKSMMIWLGEVSSKLDKLIHLIGLRNFWNNWATNSSDFELCFRVMAVIELRFSSPSPAAIEMGFGIILIIIIYNSYKF